jgi:hypothetical protein
MLRRILSPLVLSRVIAAPVMTQQLRSNKDGKDVARFEDDADDDFGYFFLDELFEGGGDTLDFVPPEEAKILRSEKR